MKYRANPVIVEAYKIIGKEGSRLDLEDDLSCEPTPEMLSRITPEIGDYLVIQDDGYQYLNPRHVFERKYSPISDKLKEIE